MPAAAKPGRGLRPERQTRLAVHHPAGRERVVAPHQHQVGGTVAEGTGLPPALVRYWSKGGEGGDKIGWGRPGGGDFDRCRVLVNAEVPRGGAPPLSDRVVSGLCATLHKLNTGASPG